MTALLPARRRAEAFAEQVEAMLEDQDARADGGAATTFAPLLEVVAELVTTSRRGEDDRPRASFSAELRERLMLAADTELVATDQRLILATGNRQSSAERRRSRLATAAAALAVVAGTAGVATASSHAVPGQSLYPFKRGFEQAQRALTFGDAARGRDLLGQARARLDEISRLQAGAGDHSQLPQTVSAFIDEADQGSDLLIKASNADGDPASAAAVRSFAGPAMAQLTRISASASQSLQPALAQAAMLLADVDQQAATLCGGCGPSDSMTLPAELQTASAALPFLLIKQPSKASPTVKPAEPADDPQKTTGARTDQSAGDPKLPDTGGVLNSGADGNQPVPGSSSGDSRVISDPLDRLLNLNPPGVKNQAPSGGDKDLDQTLKDVGGGANDTTKKLTDNLNKIFGGALGGLADPTGQKKQ